MKENRIARFFAAWLFLMLLLPVALFWLAPDFAPEVQRIALLKVSVIIAVVAAAVLALAFAVSRRWALPARDLEDFVAALPGEKTPLTLAGAPELQALTRATNAMAGRVRHVVERANLETARRETVLAGMAEGVLSVDENLKVIFCNDAFAQAFGARTPIPEGRTLYEVVREPVLREILERVLRTGTAATDRFQLPAAAGRWFEARALPLRERARHGAVLVLHDVTDLQRQEQLRKDFVANVSHELRTPLAAIRGYAETLLDGGLEDQANNRKFVEIILSHTVRLNNIASDLLVLSELDSCAPSVPPEPVSLPQVIESAVRTVENAAAVSGVHLNLDDCRDCFVRGHRFRLEQVMVNLLDNAVKFNRAGGEVRVACGLQTDNLVTVSVADTGIGIPSEDLKRIFERFYRIDKARSRPTGGTGLGLPIVKQVIEQMNGTVSVESQLGRGSKFTVTLPTA